MVQQEYLEWQGERFARLRRAGAVADGAFKVVLGGLFIAGVGWLGPVLDVPTWLMLLSGVVLLGAGGVEVGLVDRRSPRLYTWLMIAYDSCWVLSAATGLLLARAGSSAGGLLWISYQTVAPLLFAAVLMAARDRRHHGADADEPVPAH